ncbi:hypothetical protein GGX14DRAFT_380483 [Mycena pura]|uniref:CxC1-like cysteine cluster associated with KDZ transposases domain-containing protein n=1 Tax=Mycena pura TaxID=153505 RepID=A0AAD6XXX7_9AGAR|nr:hypothetical protein GGX14DRAFT_380483 [Mycena pura]
MKELDILQRDPSTLAGIVRNGIIPCSSAKPTVGITIRALELFRTMKGRSPSLSKTSFTKSLCDLHKLPDSSTLPGQFTIAYDVYVEILERNRAEVLATLKRDTPSWRLKNCCPACTYKLEGEPKMRFEMLFTMDGNNSLKRVLRRAAVTDLSEDGEDTSAPRPSSERLDDRQPPGDYYLSRETVDKWSRDALDPFLREAEAAANPCAGSWKSISDDLVTKMWGIYEETGVFLALCRHGFVLLICDMVRSGELSKYPLAMVEALLDAFGAGLGGGYDVGCKLEELLAKSPLGPRARDLTYTSLIGIFHGRGHSRKCQVKNFARYVVGLGLEPLEEAEEFFSRSNALAGSTRYASRFHRQQDIVLYLQHIDRVERAASLSKLLCSRYKEAIKVRRMIPELKRWMKKLNIADTSVLDDCLREEEEWLETRSKEPLVETLEMEYYQRLVNLNAAEATLKKAWETTTPQQHASNPTLNNLVAESKRVADQERARRAALELQMKHTDAVLNLEKKLNIVERWKPSDPEWEAAATMVARRRYQRCVDELEASVVARIFELGEMNRAHTGYKLRMHMAKAIQARSTAIRACLERYNAAASTLPIPRDPLSWDQVVEYSFIGDFELLRETNRVDPGEKLWANPSVRYVMDMYFKIKRAGEEIFRLNLEIPRHITWMKDEEETLTDAEAEVAKTDEFAAFQIRLYAEERTRFNGLHRKRYRQLALDPAFTGSLKPGTRRKDEVESMEVDFEAADALHEPPPADVIISEEETESEEDSDWDDYDGEPASEEEEEEVSEMMERLVVVSLDK